MNIRAKIFGEEGGEAEPLLPPKQPTGVRPDALHSIRVERNEARSTDTRLGDRHWQPGESVRLVHEGNTYDAELVNVSDGGAMVAAPAFEPMLWDKVELHFGNDETAECTVLWIKDGRVGLEFGYKPRFDPPEED
jgi:hypothetical protein